MALGTSTSFSFHPDPPEPLRIPGDPPDPVRILDPVDPRRAPDEEGTITALCEEVPESSLVTPPKRDLLCTGEVNLGAYVPPRESGNCSGKKCDFSSEK